MKEREALNVTKGEVEDNEQNLLLRLNLRNDSNATLHFISVVRQLLYDPASHELTIRLSETGLNDLPIQPPFEVPPPMGAVDPHDEREITVKVPRYVTRVEPGPSIIQLPAHEAKTVTVEVGWSDKAFYQDPRGKAGSIRAQLKKWERGIARWQGREVKRPKPPSSEDLTSER